MPTIYFNGRADICGTNGLMPCTCTLKNIISLNGHTEKPEIYYPTPCVTVYVRFTADTRAL